MEKWVDELGDGSHLILLLDVLTDLQGLTVTVSLGDETSNDGLFDELLKVSLLNSCSLLLLSVADWANNTVQFLFNICTLSSAESLVLQGLLFLLFQLGCPLLLSLLDFLFFWLFASSAFASCAFTGS